MLYIKNCLVISWNINLAHLQRTCGVRRMGTDCRGVRNALLTSHKPSMFPCKKIIPLWCWRDVLSAGIEVWCLSSQNENHSCVPITHHDRFLQMSCTCDFGCRNAPIATIARLSQLRNSEQAHSDVSIHTCTTPPEHIFDYNECNCCFYRLIDHCCHWIALHIIA